MVEQLQRFFIGSFLAFLFLMPLWLRAVSRMQILVFFRRCIMTEMLIVSIASTIYAIVRPHPPHVPTLIVGSVVWIIYLFLVFLVFFMSWPRSWPNRN